MDFYIYCQLVKVQSIKSCRYNMVNRIIEYDSSSKKGLKGTSKPRELFANCFIVIILHILSETLNVSEIFVLQIGQTILGFKTYRESNHLENVFLISYKMNILL